MDLPRVYRVRRSYEPAAALSSLPREMISTARRSWQGEGEKVRRGPPRPGSTAHFGLPSRAGDYLHWPDGRITRA